MSVPALLIPDYVTGNIILGTLVSGVCRRRNRLRPDGARP